ncbi:MAG: glycosyltransferase family A protein [Thermoanaerobaculia bacterium]
MASPLVSVIVRTRDRPALLAEALSSLSEQTLRDFETVVVADGGARPPAEILEPAPGEGGLTLIHRSPPHGRARALNAGLDAARGRFIAYLDDDDLFLPGHLETLARFLEGSDVYRVAYTDVEQVEQTLGADGRYHEGRRLVVYGLPYDPNRLLSSNYISLIGLMHEANDLRYDESFDILEDWDFMLRLAERGRFHRIAGVTAIYRLRDDQTNATTVTPWHGATAEAARRKLFAKHWHRHDVESQTALVDSFQNEAWLLRTQRAQLEERNAADSAVATKLAAELAAERAAATSWIGRLEADLLAFRGDASRQLQAAGERESALLATLQQIYDSTSWRTLSRWWRFKARLLGR